MQLLEKLNKLIEENPEQQILISKETVFTYTDVKRYIDIWKSELERCGIFERAKVAIYVEETIDIVGVYFALCELDCVVIPIDISAKRSTISKIIESSNAHFLISLKKLDSLHFQKAITLSSGYTIYRTCYKENDVPSDIMQFLYTSGTTGLPKCVMFSKESMENNIIGIANQLELSKADVIYTPISLMLPAAFNTVLLPALLSGAKIFVGESTVPSGVLRNIVRQKITVFFAVPFFYRLLTSNSSCEEEIWKNVRLCLTSSAYLSEEDFMSFYRRTRKGLHSIYCSSEAGTISYNDSEEVDIQCKFVGKPLKGCQVSLFHPNDDGIGEIVVKGSMVSSQYYKNERLSQEVYHNGWVRTGDIGYIHEDGNLEIKGRLSDTINIAGHLVNPLEVEQVIMKLEEVKDVMAYKYINNVKNDMLGVQVSIHEGAFLSERNIIEYCTAVLPSYKVPKKVQFVDCIDIGRYGKKRRNVQEI